ncbi:MAG: RecX family transcriptional regulator [Rhodospirillales bacterium]|nr:RecX family transcriptional regulator [Rhodospirillales bacterium]
MPGKVPDAAALYEAATNHLSRYATTEANLARVLARRVDRWAQQQAAEPDQDAGELIPIIRRAKAEIPAILTRLRELGALNDQTFAASRAARLSRSGKSRRATIAHLAAKGISAPDLPDDPQRELAAACAYLRRRRAGPFGNAPADKILAAMARGGFSQAIARRAFSLSSDEAKALIKSLSAPP